MPKLHDQNISTIQDPDQNLVFLCNERFEKMAIDCVGDLPHGMQMMQQAFQLLQDFEDAAIELANRTGEPPTTFQALNTMMFTFFLLCASSPDFTTDNVKTFMIDRFVHMWPCAQEMTDQLREFHLKSRH